MISHHALNPFYIMIEPPPPAPLTQPSPPLPRFIDTNEHELSHCLFEYYLNLRSDQIPSLTTHIPQQFAAIQQEIIEVVELRKEMEATVQMAVAEQLHFDTVAGLVDHRIGMEGQVDRLAQQVKQLQSRNVAKIVEELSEVVKKNSRPQRELIEQGQELSHLLSDFRREISLYSQPHPNPPHSQPLDCDSPLISAFFTEQQEKWKMTKQIYGAKFRQLLLRQELIEQRERAFFDYERTNSDLIEVLLREKERDKNLRKKDKEKFEQMLKMRHEIDIENENLSHTERTLNSRYEVELLKMKNQLQLIEGEQQKERQKMSKLMEVAQKERNEKEREKSEREEELEESIKELKMAVELANEQKKGKDNEIRQLEVRYEKLLTDYTNLAAKLSQFERMNQQTEERNEQLQSQHNELILKNSQNNQKKLQITQKLQQRNRRVEELQKENGKIQNDITSFKMQIDETDKALVKWEQQYSKISKIVQENKLKIAQLQKEKAQNEQKIVHQQEKISQQFEKIKHLDEKTAYLEAELTNLFISHNEDRKQLLEQLQDKTTRIAHLNEQLTTAQTLPPSALAALKSDLLIQLQRASHQKRCILDSFLLRMDCLPL